MKAILEFDLPEDKEQFYGSAKALDFWLCLCDFEQFLRYLTKSTDSAKAELAENLLSQFWEMLEDRNVTLDEYS